jgi:outer membrane protein assembly factor BamD
VKKNFLFIFLILILISCSSKKEIKKNDGYIKGMKYLKAGNYSMAGEVFEKIDDDFPFTEEATNGLIMSAYSYYKANMAEDSVRIIDYFIQSNPVSRNLDYLYYLKGLNYYSRITLMSRMRDVMESANNIFNNLIYAFPNSEYKDDSLKKIKEIEEYLAGNDIIVGNFYLDKKNYIGAIHHFKNVINNYPNSSFMSEALYRLIEVNSLLDLKLEAIQYYKILSENYKNNSWENNAKKIIKNYDI